MDLSKLSDQELEQLASGKAPAPKSNSVDLQSLSDSELEALAGGAHLEDPSLLSKIGQGVVKVGQFVDSYTGAPSRAAVGAIQDGKSPLSAFAGQFGEDPKKAPSGKDIMLKAGASDVPVPKLSAAQLQARDEQFNPGLAAALKKSNVAYQDQPDVSPADALGLIGDVGIDYTNILPLGLLAKTSGRGVKATGSALLSGVGKVAEVTGNAVKALPGGRTAVKALEVAAEAPRAVKQSLEKVFRVKQTGDFPEMISVAQKNGIDPNLLPSSVEFGPTSFASRNDRALREGPLGQVELEKFQAGHNAVQQATTSKINQISGGHVPSPIEAGGVIRQGYNDAVDRLFDNVDFTYNQVIKQAPGIALTPDAMAAINTKVKEVEKYAIGLKKRAITNTEIGQANQLLRAVQGIRAGNGSLEHTYESMSQLGRHAFKKAKNSLADVPVDEKKMQDLYFALRDGFVNTTATHLGDDVASALIDSNNQITMFNANKKYVAKLIGNDHLADERLFNSLILNGDSKKITALKEILSPEQLQSLKGSVLENLIKRDPDGMFNFQTLHSAMRHKRNVLESLFEPQELVEFGQLVKLGDSFGPAILSSSGTGASNSFFDLPKAIGNNVLSRTVGEGLKESGRGRGLAPALGDAAQVERRTYSPAQKAKFSFPRRTSPEEVAKYLQVIGASDASQDNQSSSMRRIEAIKRLRGATN